MQLACAEGYQWSPVRDLSRRALSRLKPWAVIFIKE